MTQEQLSSLIDKKRTIYQELKITGVMHHSN